MPRLHALAAALLLTALAGCADPDPADDGELMPHTYHMRVEGMPDHAMRPGERFNITVHGEMGDGMGMHRMDSDHIGAHFWNRTMADPSAALGNATSCAHLQGEMPGEFRAQCTAPMQPGTYHLRGHARMMDGHADHGGMHHYWSDERTFTVS